LCRNASIQAVIDIKAAMLLLAPKSSITYGERAKGNLHVKANIPGRCRDRRRGQHYSAVNSPKSSTTCVNLGLRASIRAVVEVWVVIQLLAPESSITCVSASTQKETYK
jgi:hypothetical protein